MPVLCSASRTAHHVENSAVHSCQPPTPLILPGLHCCDRSGSLKARDKINPPSLVKYFVSVMKDVTPAFYVVASRTVEDESDKPTLFGTPSGSAAVSAHPPKERGFPGLSPLYPREVVDPEMLKAETRPHCAASSKASFLVDRGHRAWPGGAPASREVKWGLRRVRHTCPSDWRRCLCKPEMAPGGWHFGSHSASSAEDAAFELPGAPLSWSRSGS